MLLQENIVYTMKELAEGGDWDKFNQQFMETTGCYCDFALELEETAFE